MSDKSDNLEGNHQGSRQGNRQLELLPFGNPDAIKQPARPELVPTSTLGQAMPSFQQHMRERALAANTIRAQNGDLALYMERVGKQTRLNSVTPASLDAFMHWLEHDRGVPCSPKSLYRRGTTLKVFFQWLVDESVLDTNPAARIVQERPDSPLPKVLDDATLARVIEVTASMDTAPEDADARPHLLVTLILDTSMKKAEALRLALADIDLTNPERPSVYVRYDKPRQRIKSRRLKVSPEWPHTLERYVIRYKPKERLFECSGRNLEYVLRNISILAGMPHNLTFEMLRWTSALRAYKAGMDEDRLRRKLGLSQMAWRETLANLQKLADEPL